MLGATLALTAGLAMVSAGPAWGAAAPKPKGKVLCTTVTGTVTGTITISGCSGTANTGASSQPLSVGALASGGTVTWASTKTSTFSAAVTSATNAKKYPGYVKGAQSNPSAIKFSGTVTADTSGMKIPGKYKGAVCVNGNNITALKPLKAN
jgi:hypothetical protein